MRRLLLALQVEDSNILQERLSISLRYGTEIHRVETLADLLNSKLTGDDVSLVGPLTGPELGFSSADSVLLVEYFRRLKIFPYVVIYLDDIGIITQPIRYLLANIPVMLCTSLDEVAAALCFAFEYRRNDQSGLLVKNDLTKIMQILDEVLCEPADWTPKRIAARVGLSEKTINRYLFKCGFPSLARQIADARYKLARQLIDQTKHPYNHVARLCGWTDVRSLRRSLACGDSIAE